MIWKTFLKGLAVVLPVVLTAAVVYWLGVSLERALGAAIRVVLPADLYLPGLGIVAGVALTFAAGLAMRSWVTQRLLAWAERLVARIPLAKTIYGGARDLMRFLAEVGEPGELDTVVLVTLADGVRVVGFVTDRGTLPWQHERDDGPDAPVPVYLQMSYQLGGYTVFVPRSRLERLDMSLEDAMRWVLTAGVSSSRDAPTADA